MELRQLKYFLAVSDTLHYGKAADLLHISEQPLSFQIKKLESELGFKLFERTTRSVALTPAGELLKKKTLEGLRILDKGVEQAGKIARGETGKLHIGYNSMTLHNILPHLVSEYRNRYSDVEIILSEQNSPELEYNLINEEIDLGIVALYGGAMSEELKYETIFSDPAFIAFPKNHYMKDKKFINLSDLAEEAFLVYSREVRARSYDYLIAHCHAAKFTPNIIQEAETDMALLGLVATGLGVALVPGSFRHLLTDVIDYRMINEPKINIDVAIVWKATKYSPMLRNFRDIAKPQASI
ncbi:LysR family transcriptional regulator [Paenibacillus illinoisensis]|uniref:LysR family transcriptional regulator n=1 Tax=Paenibacillus illinoisensis TaxID=59845 RepID=UPI000FD88E1E|nr:MULTISPECIES: LysR family transcriptional regulator [Paenibacillus]